MRFAGNKRPEKRADSIRSLNGQKNVGFKLLSGRKCNLLCEHCFTNSGPKEEKTAKVSTLFNILRNMHSVLKSGNVDFMAVSGGEPMLNPYYTAALILRLNQIFYKESIEQPRTLVLTNGTVWNEHISKMLVPLRKAMIIFMSTDDFHKPPAAIEKYRKNFDVREMDADRKIAALGRGYDLDDANWKTCCDAANIRYEIDGDKIIMVEKKTHRSKFKIDEDGGLHLCGYGGFTFGNLNEESMGEIVKRIGKDERALALMERGPLGLARVYGKLDDAIEIFMKKGSCGVCHALSR